MGATIRIPTPVKKGTPTPSRVLSPSKLRSARLPYSEDLARDIESLSQNLNALHSAIANNSNSASLPAATSSTPGVVKPDGTTTTVDSTGTIHAETVTLETNGVNNGSQTKLNLVAGANVTLSDDRAGNVTLASTGGGAAPIEASVTAEPSQ